ncbi:MAG: HU family DNA-binding protein [Bacteroidaceae bacterium]|nr:HU family DNA-binding protein [Bacteroidaceae bacterium]
MNNRDFTLELSRKSGYAYKDTADMIGRLIQVMTEQWQNNDSISIQNFGSFEVKKKLERISVNPVTKQRMLVPPKLVLTFRPSNVLKDKFK